MLHLRFPLRLVPIYQIDFAFCTEIQIGCVIQFRMTRKKEVLPLGFRENDRVLWPFCFFLKNP